jgi:release factor glutamine methyltransferase
MNITENVRKLLATAERSLKNLESARLDAELLLANSLNTDRAALYAYPEKEVSKKDAANFQLLVKKRIDNYPIAYLTGTREFWSLQLEVDQHTLIPRPETECLVETILEIIPNDDKYDILDLGTGSGAIALALAKERPNSNVLAVDLSPEALAVSAANAITHEISNIHFLQSDWFSELAGRQFDLIVSNPPYVDSNDRGFIEGEIRYEPRLALDGGHQGMQAITHLIPAATHFLKPGGWLVLEHGYQQANTIQQLFTDIRYRNIHTRQDYAGLDRLSFAQWQ